MPQIEGDWFETFDPVGLTFATWVNRLEKYYGPRTPLATSTMVYQVSYKAEVPSPTLQTLGLLVDQQLLGSPCDQQPWL